MNNDLIKINYRQERIGIRTYKIKFIAEIMQNEVVQKNGTLFCIKIAENGSKEN